MNWTEEDHALLSREYPDTPTKEIAAKLGRTDRAVYVMARKMDLKKTDAYLRDHVHTLDPKVGEPYRYQKGREPWNKGGTHNPRGSEKGWFKAGHKPHTWKPVGAERYDKDGHKLIKVSDTGNKWSDWRREAHIVWEKNHGPIPEGMCLIHKDRDKINCQLSNLMLVDRKGLMEFNTVHRYPPEMKHAIKLVKKLNREVEHEEQNA